MSDTPLKRTTRRTTSVRRTVQTTSGSISTTGPTRNTSVNIATAFKLSGLSEPTSDTDSPSRKPRDSNVNTSAPIRDLEQTDTEEELSDMRTDTDSDEEELPNNTHSTGLGRRFLSSILPHSPQWIRATTPQHDESTGNETESELDQDDGNPTEVLHTKNTDSTRLNRISEAPSTVNLVAGRYYLRPRPNSPARSVGRAPGQLHEHLATSSDDDEWSPKPTFSKSTHVLNHDTNQKIAENLQEDSEESSSDENSFSGSDSEEEYPQVVKIPIWHPIQTLIVGCFAGVGQVVKSIFSAIGFLVFMVIWIFKEIVGSLYFYTKSLLYSLFIVPLRSLFTSGHIKEYVNSGVRGCKNILRPLAKNIGLVLIISTIAGILWANLSSQSHDDTFERLREKLNRHKLPKLDTIKLKLPDVSLPSFKHFVPSLKVEFPSWSSLLKNRVTSKGAHKTIVSSPPDWDSAGRGKYVTKDSANVVIPSHPSGSNIDSESFDKLKSRLESLETSLEHLSFIANNLVKQDTDLGKAVSSEAVYQTDVRSEIESLKNLFGELTKNTQHQRHTIKSILGTMVNNDRKLEGFSIHTESLKKQIGSVESKMDSLSRSLENTHNDLEVVKKRIDEISQYDYYSRQILNTVERALPKYLLAKKNGETGGIDIAPEFYHYLNSLFVTPQMLQSMVQDNVKSSQPNPPSWSEFMDTNQKELHSLIQGNIAESVESMSYSGTVVTREDFLFVLQKKLDDLKEQVTSKIQSDINEVVKEIDRKSFLDPHTGLAANTDTVSLINHLIEDALAKYSADTLGLPDYALYSGGGRVIPSLTSTTYHVPSKSAIARIGAKLLGLSALGLGNPPTTALNPDIHLGQCWPFPGDHGNLTVLLSRHIIPTNFSIEHVPRSVAIDVRSAPRKVAVYALYEKTKDMQDDANEELLDHEGKSYVQQYLSSYEYDVNNPRHIQTFPVQAQIEISRPIRIVQLRILNNYGQDTYTCLYRFRVHGKIAE